MLILRKGFQVIYLVCISTFLNCVYCVWGISYSKLRRLFCTYTLSIFLAVELQQHVVYGKYVNFLVKKMITYFSSVHELEYLKALFVHWDASVFSTDKCRQDVVERFFEFKSRLKMSPVSVQETPHLRNPKNYFSVRIWQRYLWNYDSCRFYWHIHAYIYINYFHCRSQHWFFPSEKQTLISVIHWRGRGKGARVLSHPPPPLPFEDTHPVNCLT